MTEAQEQHLQQIKDRVCAMIDEKYRLGAEKHGGNLADVPFPKLLQEIKMEIVDLMVYWAAAEIVSEKGE